MSLEILYSILEFFIFPGPIIVLVAGVILYFFLKSNRKMLGIVIIALGVVELAVFSLALYYRLTPDIEGFRYIITVGMIGSWIVLLDVEVVTIIFGIFSLRKGLKKE